MRRAALEHRGARHQNGGAGGDGALGGLRRDTAIHFQRDIAAVDFFLGVDALARVLDAVLLVRGGGLDGVVVVDLDDASAVGRELDGEQPRQGGEAEEPMRAAVLPDGSPLRSPKGSSRAPTT